MRRIGILAGAVAAVALIVFACSGDDDAGSGATGGAGGGAAGGAAGASPIPTIQCTIPKCISDLQDDCKPTGPCTTDGTKNCYANGVKATSVLDLNSGGYVVTYTKPNGSTCYITDVVSMGGGWSVTVKDASGKTVATATTDAQNETTVTCAGREPVKLTAGCTATGGLVQGGGTTCTAGACN